MQKIKETLKGIFSLTVILLYSVTIMPIHEHKHDHAHVVEHSLEVHQNDHCHNYIYHGDLSSDCKNHNHASEDDIECLICHHFVASQKLFVAPSIHIDFYFDNETSIVNHSNPHFDYKGYTNTLRGPPTVA